MTHFKLLKRFQRLSALVAAASSCMAALAGIASAAQHYVKVVQMPEIMCGPNHDVLVNLEAHAKEQSASPAQLVDQHFWNRDEVAEPHKGILFEELYQTAPENYSAYIDIWWEEAERVELCLVEYKAAYEQSPGWLQLIYPKEAQQRFQVAKNVVTYIQMQR